MTGTAFFDVVDNAPDMQWKGIVDGRACIGVARYGQVLGLSFETIAKCSWGRLAAVLRREQKPENMYHVSRVVGYYSRIQNWNKSKLGELKARHAGDYRVG